MKKCAITLIGTLLLAAPAAADVFHVNSTRDATDLSPGDGMCRTGSLLPAPRDGEPECTVRAAIQEANARWLHMVRHTIHIPAGTYRLTIATVTRDVEDDRQRSSEWGARDAVVTGDLDVEANVEIIGEGEARTIIDAGGIDRVMDIYGRIGDAISISRLTLRGGASTAGGALRNGVDPIIVRLSHVTIADSGHPEALGGGILNLGSLLMDRVTIRNNSANRGGGLDNQGLAELRESTIANNRALPVPDVPLREGSGGGISNVGVYSTAVLRLYTSTVSDNRAARRGGGILNRGTAVLVNVTIGENYAPNGGGIALDDPLTGGESAMSLVYTTVAWNSAGRGGSGGIHRYSSPPLLLSHVILAHNMDNCVGGVSSSNHSLEDDNTCGLVGPGDRPGMPAQLEGPLQYNGGPTKTFRLTSTSPAIDMGHVRELMSPMAEFRDQRGAPRPLGEASDAGAYEHGINPAVLMGVIPVRFYEVFERAWHGSVFEFVVEMEMEMGDGSSKGASEDAAARIMAVKAGQFEGQLQVQLDTSGRLLTVRGKMAPPPPSDNVEQSASDPILFYVELQRPVHGAARLRFTTATCDCMAKDPRPAPIVVAPYIPKGVQK
jgi:hypothetical protein